MPAPGMIGSGIRTTPRRWVERGRRRWAPPSARSLPPAVEDTHHARTDVSLDHRGVPPRPAAAHPDRGLRRVERRRRERHLGGPLPLPAVVGALHRADPARGILSLRAYPSGSPHPRGNADSRDPLAGQRVLSGGGALPPPGRD